MTGKVPRGTFRATEHVPFPHPKSQNLSAKFSADIAAHDLDALMESIQWYMKIPWITGVNRDAVLALFKALPDLMERFREEIASDIERKPALTERLPAAYIEAFRTIG